MPRIELSTRTNAPLERCVDLSRDLDLHRLVGAHADSVVRDTARLGWHVHAQIDRDDSDQATVVAHELGHVLLGDGHVSAPANLMCNGNPCNGHTLTPNDCSVARTKAAEFAERFRAYNVKVKRVPASNPFTPNYPDPNIQDPSVVSFAWTCCDNGGGKFWAPMMMCPGSALPDAACTECCVVSETPVDVEFMRLGTCGGATMAADQCNLVCCSMGAWTGFVAQAECLPNGGAPLEREYCL